MIYVVVAVILAALKTPLNLLRLRQVARWVTGKDVGSRGGGGGRGVCVWNRKQLTEGGLGGGHSR